MILHPRESYLLWYRVQDCSTGLYPTGKLWQLPKCPIKVCFHTRKIDLASLCEHVTCVHLACKYAKLGLKVPELVLLRNYNYIAHRHIRDRGRDWHYIFYCCMLSSTRSSTAVVSSSTSSCIGSDIALLSICQWWLGPSGGIYVEQCARL